MKYQLLTDERIALGDEMLSNAFRGWEPVKDVHVNSIAGEYTSWIFRRPIPEPVVQTFEPLPEGYEYHNPDGLEPADIPDGWRLLVEFEVDGRYKRDFAGIQLYARGQKEFWISESGGWDADVPGNTYITNKPLPSFMKSKYSEYSWCQYQPYVDEADKMIADGYELVAPDTVILSDCLCIIRGTYINLKNSTQVGKLAKNSSYPVCRKPKYHGYKWCRDKFTGTQLEADRLIADGYELVGLDDRVVAGDVLYTSPTGTCISVITSIGSLGKDLSFPVGRKSYRLELQKKLDELKVAMKAVEEELSQLP